MKELANVVGSPGVRPRFTGFLKGVLPMLVFMAFAGYFIRAAFPVPEVSRVVAGLALVVLCGLLGATLFYSEKRLGSYFKGAQGEERVARALHQLSSEYTVFHGVVTPGRGGDIDHVVVGPTGIFVVETKNWAGRISVVDGEVLYNGHTPSRPPLRQASNSAAQLQKAIRRDTGCDVDIDATLCFAGGRVQGDIQHVDGVVICSVENIREVLLDSSRVHLPEDRLKTVTQYLETAERKSA